VILIVYRTGDERNLIIRMRRRLSGKEWNYFIRETDIDNRIKIANDIVYNNKIPIDVLMESGLCDGIESEVKEKSNQTFIQLGL